MIKFCLSFIRKLKELYFGYKGEYSFKFLSIKFFLRKVSITSNTDKIVILNDIVAIS